MKEETYALIEAMDANIGKIVWEIYDAFTGVRAVELALENDTREEEEPELVKEIEKIVTTHLR
jgi:hypothetical protein